MSILWQSKKAELGSADSAVGFAGEGGEYWEVWDRYLTINGRKAFHIGNVCNTCAFFFERLSGGESGVCVAGVANELAAGVTAISQDVVTSWANVLPQAEYQICLFDVQPTPAGPGSETDYFSHDLTDLWDVDGMSGVPIKLHTDYYRLGSTLLGEGAEIFEFLVPMFPKDELKMDDTKRYLAALERGDKPTAVAISVLDYKQPAEWTGEPEVTEHLCLAHYLLDGHHKVLAAAQSGRPISLLSFLAVKEGLANPAQIQQALEALRPRLSVVRA